LGSTKSMSTSSDQGLHPMSVTVGMSRLLFVRLRSLGDTVLMTPALAVAKRCPGLQVGVVIEEPFHEVLVDNPHIDQLFVIRQSRNKLFARLQALRAIRSFRPDGVIDLHGGSTSALLSRLSRAAMRIGYAQNRHTRFYTEEVPHSSRIWGKERVHTVEHQLSPLKHLGFPVDPVPPLHARLSSDDVVEVRGMLGKLGVTGEFILIHPGAAFATKQWEAQRFSELANQLAEQGYPVVFTIGPGETSVLEAVHKGCVAAVRFVDPQSIRKFSALASLCRLYIGNDTGTTHIAAALGKKIAVIFGSSDSSVWHPWGVPYRMLRSDLPCIPCPGYYCLHYDEPRCIRSIEVSTVLEAVLTLL